MKFHVKNIMAEQSSELITTYFDGNTESGEDYSYNWSGDIGASESHQKITLPSKVVGMDGIYARLSSKSWTSTEGLESTGSKTLRVDNYNLNDGETEGSNFGAIIASTDSNLDVYTLEVGKTYTVNAIAYIDEATNFLLPVPSKTIWVGTLDHEVISNSEQVPAGVGATLVSHTFTVSENQNLYLGYGQPTVYWDRILLVEGILDPETIPFDGNTTDGTLVGQYRYDWLGATNNSISTKSKLVNRTKTTTLTSPILNSPATGLPLTEANFNPALQTIAMGTYIYPYAKKLNITIGIVYSDPANPLVPLYKMQTFSPQETQMWTFVGESFDLPEKFVNLRMIITVEYTGDYENYEFLVNGLTLGQWSEQFYVESIGGLPETLPSNILPSGTGVKARPYGLQDVSGYYMTSFNALCATNFGIPLVYGASNSTRITPTADGSPSMLIPGFGFMNESGQYSELTAEFWMRVKTSASTPRKIFGPISSTDGIYVNDAFIILKVGTHVGSYYITEWERPMLVAIRLSGESASLVINGEEVISLDFEPNTIKFPPRYITIGSNEKDQDWLGFYAYQDVPLIEIDCVGIYPYIVPNIVEKRRWIYGQAVDTPGLIAGANTDSTISVDYLLANYSKNYMYPDIGKWDQGINENLKIENNRLSLIDYELPNPVFSDKTSKEFYEDLGEAQSGPTPFISLRPNNLWSNTGGYLEFNSIETLVQNTKSLYGLFATDSLSPDKQTLFYMENNNTGSNFEIYVKQNEVFYVFNQFNNNATTSEQIIYVDEKHVSGTMLIVGLDFDSFANGFGSEISSFSK
jgi:hypothetical protein